MNGVFVYALTAAVNPTLLVIMLALLELPLIG